MIKVKKMIEDMKYLESKRRTMYNNHYPYNCGYLWPSKYLSFDCIGLIKTYINYPDIVYKTEPAGTWVKPGTVIPDATEYGILLLCTGRSKDFSKIKGGAYLYYEGGGHGGLYVGEYKDPSGIVNTIECTTDMGGGVVSSYTDSNGYRWDHKGGVCFGRWIEYGYLTRYVDYSTEKKPAKKKTVTAIAKEVIAGKWGVYPARKKKLEAAGYDYEKVQKKVNEMLTKSKS